MTSLKKRLTEIICQIIGANGNEFSITKYLEEGWMTENDLYKGLKKLLKEFVNKNNLLNGEELRKELRFLRGLSILAYDDTNKKDENIIIESIRKLIEGK